MRPIECESNGIRITVVEVNKNKIFPCANCSSFSKDHCGIKKKLTNNTNSPDLICTEIVVVIANLSNRPINVASRCWEIVDTEGFSYGCCALCDDHRAKRTVDPDSWEITPGTQVKFSLAFPELDEKTNVVALIASRLNVRINIRKPTKKVEELLKAKEMYQEKNPRAFPKRDGNNE